MKSKQILGIALLTIVGACFTASAFADDSTISVEEAKRLKAENAKLKKALERKNDDEPISQPKKAENEPEAESNFWGGINLKYWMASYKPSEGYATTTHGQVIPTLAIGYGNFFYTLTFTTDTVVHDNSYPAGGITLQEQSFGFGYKVSSSIALVAGYKTFTELNKGNPLGNNPTATNDAKFTTLAAVFNWAIPGTEAAVFGNVAAGQGAKSTSYTGYELGMNYNVLASTKVSLGYKSESMAMPYNGTATQSGPFGGINYSF